jgi:drug/metabolite transporter (DMT)-like permease
MLVILASFVWSTGGLIVRTVSTDAFTTVFWRATSCLLFLMLYVAVAERGQIGAAFRQAGWQAVLTGAFFATGSISFIWSLSLTTVANTMIVQSLAPLIAAVLGLMLLKERVAWHTWAAIGAAVAGILVMLGRVPNPSDLAGTLLALVNATAFAASIVSLRLHRNTDMIPAACWATLFAASVASPFASPLTASFGDMLLLWLFGSVQLGLGLILFMAGARLLPAAQTSLLTFLETVLAPIWVWLIYAENPGPWVLAGGVIVLGALIVHTVVERSRGRRTT